MTESLSIQQARKLILHSQLLPKMKKKGKAVDATLSAIEHLGYIQIDTISAIHRAHHHTLWNRNPRYKLLHLGQLLEKKQVFEYWSHAASYLPMTAFRYTLPRKRALLNNKQTHWYRKDTQLMDAILSRIRTEGPLLAKDFENGEHRSGEWKSKPAKRALESLFMQGDLMVPYRVNFQKVYDLTERVLPANIDTTLPTYEEHARFLITNYLQANGVGNVNEVTYLLKDIKQHVTRAAKEMLLNGELIKLKVGKENYLVLPESLKLLDKPLRQSRLKILSPFDNLLIQRKRIRNLFDFDYLLECYLPSNKRKYGYFSLPILWGGNLIARMDCKVERSRNLLKIKNLVLEPNLKKVEEFITALKKELLLFLKFNNCETFVLQKSTPAYLDKLLSGR